MRVEVREIPPYRIAYMRHVGPYGISGYISTRASLDRTLE